MPRIYSHGSWSYCRQVRSLLQCSLSVERYQLLLFVGKATKKTKHNGKKILILTKKCNFKGKCKEKRRSKMVRSKNIIFDDRNNSAGKKRQQISHLSGHNFGLPCPKDRKFTDD